MAASSRRWVPGFAGTPRILVFQRECVFPIDTWRKPHLDRWRPTRFVAGSMEINRLRR